jgi:hypothetical protein
MSAQEFVERVFTNLPPFGARFSARSWHHQERPTSEGVGVLPTSQVDVDAFAARVLDLNHYVGNIDFVAECRTIDDDRFSPPASTRFYQRVKIPVLGSVHHELVLQDQGERDGWRVLAWDLLEPETDQLSSRQGSRSEYNVGAWLIRPGAVAYALSSAPRRGDVGRLKYAAMTKGADAGAGRMLQANIEGMLAWSRR